MPHGTRPACLIILAWAPVLMATPPFPGGILDPSGRTAYLASQTGIDAVDLTTGQVDWQTRDAHLPLLVAGERLYCLGLMPTHRLMVVAIDLPSRGQKVYGTEVTEFPRWVSTRDSATQTFRCDWHRDRQMLLIDWRAHGRTESGPAKSASGQVRIDLDTGRVYPSTVTVLPPRPVDPPTARLERQSVRWQGRAGGQHLAVVMEEVGESRPGQRQQRLVLLSWDGQSGKQVSRRELLVGERLVVLPDLDGKHLWLRDAAGSAEFPGKLWQVVSNVDGLPVARAPWVPGTQVATRVGTRAYFLATAPIRTSLGEGPVRRQRTLYAVDLESGKTSWARGLGTPTAP